MIANAASGQPAQAARHGVGLGLALGVVLFAAATARAQQTPTQAGPAVQSEQVAPSETPPPVPPQAPRQDGFFGSIGRWIDGSIASVNTARKGTSETAPGEARNTGGIGFLRKTKIVSGRERCETAANGAPDCRGATEALCRSKGLAAGKSLDVQSVEKCPARVWISGTQPKTGECRMESYVQRAFCR